jgi:hypothetical protein
MPNCLCTSKTILAHYYRHLIYREQGDYVAATNTMEQNGLSEALLKM